MLPIFLFLFVPFGLLQELFCWIELYPSRKCPCWLHVKDLTMLIALCLKKEFDKIKSGQEPKIPTYLVPEQQLQVPAATFLKWQGCRVAVLWM